MRLIIDMDEVLVDFLGPLLDKYNKRYDKEMVLDDIKSWDLPQEMINIFLEDDFFLTLPPLSGAIDGIRELKQNGHDIIIATSPSERPGIAREKMIWMKVWLPEFVHDLHIVERKDRLIGDLLIDDSPKHLNNFKGKTMCMARRYNEDVTSTFRVKNWTEIKLVINNLDCLNKQWPGRDYLEACGR